MRDEERHEKGKREDIGRVKCREKKKRGKREERK
jgi:hypothetical protein